jgi:hypothetical protein
LTKKMASFWFFEALFLYNVIKHFTTVAILKESNNTLTTQRFLANLHNNVEFLGRFNLINDLFELRAHSTILGMLTYWKRRQIFWWAKCFRASNSVVTRGRSSPIAFLSMILTATFSPVSRCVASLTFPNPPDLKAKKQ